MTKEEYKEAITPAVVERIFSGHIVTVGAPRFVITVGGKIVTINGRMFFDSHEQAMKAFYNSFSWKAKREIWEAAHPGEENSYRWWRNPDSRHVWEAFKEIIKRDFGFNIIEV